MGRIEWAKNWRPTCRLEVHAAATRAFLGAEKEDAGATPAGLARTVALGDRQPTDVYDLVGDWRSWNRPLRPGALSHCVPHAVRNWIWGGQDQGTLSCPFCARFTATGSAIRS